MTPSFLEDDVFVVVARELEVRLGRMLVLRAQEILQLQSVLRPHLLFDLALRHISLRRVDLCVTWHLILHVFVLELPSLVLETLEVHNGVPRGTKLNKHHRCFLYGDVPVVL